MESGEKSNLKFGFQRFFRKHLLVMLGKAKTDPVLTVPPD